MNQDTPWLQVPSAEMQKINLYNFSTDAEKLDQIAFSLAMLQECEQPYLTKSHITLFVSNQSLHIENTLSSIQTINSELVNSKVEIINLGPQVSLKSDDCVTHSPIGGIVSQNHAMTREQLAKAINIGRQTAQRIKRKESRLFIASEINNKDTLSAYAMTCALLNINYEELTDISSEHKIIQQALELHKEQLNSPLDILRCLGNFEIAALTGSYLCCAHMGLPVLVDGFASTLAAFITSQLCPQSERWFIYSRSATGKAHKYLYKRLKAKPILQIDKGIDTIASISMSLSLLNLACNNHNETNNFANEELLLNYY